MPKFVCHNLCNFIINLSLEKSKILYKTLRNPILQKKKSSYVHSTLVLNFKNKIVAHKITKLRFSVRINNF